MTINSLLDSVDVASAGEWMHDFIRELFPVCRSITGEGLRTTLRRIGSVIPVKIHEVPTGTQVFDWTVPREWNIRDAWVKNERGEKVIDFQLSNLHIVQYSSPVHSTMSLVRLREHLHTLPDHPDWIPYRTTYYKESWGFCLTHRQLQALEDGLYEVLIDSSLAPGSLSYAEYFRRGRRSEEVLFSCHVCHPSLANDNLSGVALLTKLAAILADVDLEYSYRFLFIPGTIGSITWLAHNEGLTERVRHGLVAACVGDNGRFHYKRSRQGKAEIDRAVVHALRHSNHPFEVFDFTPYGYDERQFCSPGFDLPIGSLTRTPHSCYPQYHTSADNLELVRPEALAGSLAAYLFVIQILEGNSCYLNLSPKCEPQLGRRGLYRSLGGMAHADGLDLALLWVLNFSDGSHSLLDIADRSGISFSLIHESARLLTDCHLLQRAN